MEYGESFQSDEHQFPIMGIPLGIGRINIFIKYIDISKKERGPFKFEFDEVKAHIEKAKSAVYNPPENWFKFVPKRKGFYIPIMRMACGISQIRYGLETNPPNKTINFGKCRPTSPHLVPRYLRKQQWIDAEQLPTYISAQLVYRDETVSKVEVIKTYAALPSANIVWRGDYQKGADAAARGDFVTTLREWKPLAEQGHPDAQRGLGLLYIKGKGVSQDDKTAIKWYKLSAEQGHKVAQSELGVFYYRGQGVPKDLIRAKMWINIAASSGHKNAVKKSAFLAKRMTPAEISAAQKLARECIRKKYKGC